MVAKKSFYLLDPLNTIPETLNDSATSWLGRIVRDFRRPFVDYTPRAATSPAFKYHSDPQLVDVSRVIENISSPSLQFSFLDAVGIAVEDFHSRKHSFTSRSVERLRVHHDSEVLDGVINSPAVAADLAEWRTGPFQSLYLVVGLLLTDDITYTSAEVDKVEVRAHVDPTSLASMATSGVPLPGASKIGGRIQLEGGAKGETGATGRRIFAIEYRTFRGRLIQRADSKVRMRAYGPQEDRSFASTQAADSGFEVQTELDDEPLGELVASEDSDSAERCFELAIES